DRRPGTRRTTNLSALLLNVAVVILFDVLYHATMLFTGACLLNLFAQSVHLLHDIPVVRSACR
ncbi:unnamed protein product, partial [Amoebophrya sp. A120]